MTLHKTTSLAALLLVAVLTTGTKAQTEVKHETGSAFSLGVEGGTTGFGPVLIYTVSPKLNFSLSYGYLSYDESNVRGDKRRYDYDIELSNLAAVINWHPTGGRFHLSAGAVLFDHEYDITARPRHGRSFEIGDHSYDRNQITSVTGKIDTGTEVAPYLGIGWTWNLGRSGFSVITNFGLMYTQGYDAKLTATGPSANDPAFVEDLRKEEREEFTDFMKIFPVLKAGIAYRF